MQHLRYDTLVPYCHQICGFQATVDNYILVLRYDPYIRESLKYNKLTGRIDIVKILWWNDEICKLDDDARTYYYYFFERYYSLCSENCMDKAMRMEAKNRAYHPICEYLEELEWDGQERIRYVLQRYMGADASDFVYEVMKHFLMEASVYLRRINEHTAVYSF